jgi:predicted Zn-dependent protease
MNWNDHPALSALHESLARYTADHPEVADWQIRAQYSEGCQSLLLGTAGNGLTVYQDRNIDDLALSLTLYCPSADGSQLGSSSSSIDPKADLNPQLALIHSSALLAMNPFYTLPDKPTSDYPLVEAADTRLVSQLNQTHTDLIARIAAYSPSLQGVQVNSAELFSNVHHQLLQSSAGIDARKVSTDLYFEVAMERAPGPNDQEVLKYWHFVGLDDADLEAKLDAVAAETLMTVAAELPPSRDQATILIDSYGISKLVAALVNQLDAASEFAKGPHLLPGDSVVTGEADAESDQLSVTIDPSLQQMAKSSPFTADGLIAQKAEVIGNNQVLTQLINSRMAHYLGKPVNGISGNLVVNSGSLSKAELLNSADEVIEILDFSSLLVNSATLTWSSEIKLGRLYRQGQFVATLKGGIVSGNVRASLGGFKFGAQRVKRNTVGGYFEAASGYDGPEHMLIWTGIQIAGQVENT